MRRYSAACLAVFIAAFFWNAGLRRYRPARPTSWV